MRQLKLGLLGLLLGGVFAPGCGSDINAKITCSADIDCLKASKNLFDVDASADFLPQCCAGLCVVPGIGCDSGFRYLVSAPAVGECAAEPMCVAKPDLSTTDDLSDFD